MPIEFTQSDILTQLTRKAYDTDFKSLLGKNITLFKNLCQRRPKTAKGEKITNNVMIDEHPGISAQSGLTPYPFTLKNVWGHSDLQWTRYLNGMQIDGFEYEKNSGQSLEDALSGGAMGMLSSGSAKTLVAMHKNELMGVTLTSYRDINKQLYGDGSGNGNKDIGGLNIIADPNSDYAGRSPTAFGYHDWVMALEDPNSPNENGRPARWSPIYKDLQSNALAIYGDLENLLITLHRGGSIHSGQMEDEPDYEFEIYISQKVYAQIEGVMRGDLERVVTQNSNANSDVGGITTGLKWDAYNAMFYPDVDCPDNELYTFNIYCVEYNQMNDDTRYMQKWRISPTQDTIAIPFLKTHQLHCRDRSQVGRLSNFSGITA